MTSKQFSELLEHNEFLECRLQDLVWEIYYIRRMVAHCMIAACGTAVCVGVAILCHLMDLCP